MFDDSSPETEITSDDLFTREWKNAVKRIIRRNEIAKHLDKNSVREIIDAVREYEKKLGVDRLIDALVEEELLIQPKMMEVANYVYEFLAPKYSQLNAVVLLGSSVHGGAMMREVTGSEGEPDLDWAIITKVPIDKGLAININQIFIERYQKLLLNFT